MTGRLVSLFLGLNRKHHITIEVDLDFREAFNKLKDKELSIEIKQKRSKRSNDQNAYFHVLVNKIAEAQNLGDEEVKKQLVIEYGALARAKDNTIVGFKMPANVDPTEFYDYVKCFDTREEDGVLFNCYLVYKNSSKMDTKEMTRLIDGAIHEAQLLGIETDTPEQLAKYKEYWHK